MNPSDLANWHCRCGRTASIDHQVNGLCLAKKIIEELESSLAQAKAELEKLSARNSLETCAKHNEEMDRLAAQNAKLRKALDKISETPIRGGDSYADIDIMVEIANQALQNEGEEKK